MVNETLRQLRLRKGLSQEQLAHKVDLAQSTIAMIENGNRHASDSVKIKLAMFFNTTVEDLFFKNNYHLENYKNTNSDKNAD